MKNTSTLRYFQNLKYLPKAIAVFALLVLLAGCFDSSITIQVRPDGSGVIVQNLALSETFIALMQNFAAQEPSTEFFNEAEIRETAKDLGQGISFLDYKQTDRPGFRGYTARFAFQDVTKISDYTISQAMVPTFGQSEEAAPSGGTETPIFSRSSSARGTVISLTTPQRDNTPVDTSNLNTTIDPEMSVMLPYLQGMRLAARVEFIGNIVETNATHRSGNTFTIFEIDYDALATDPKNIALLLNYAEDMATLSQALEGNPGLKFDNNPQIITTFQ